MALLALELVLLTVVVVAFEFEIPLVLSLPTVTETLVGFSLSELAEETLLETSVVGSPVAVSA
ncbi:hypothetical protein NVV76_07765 [Pediococcus ethanolidurans]|uniref:hypothetical protein n=1 Tax=Pediococcus ethanolidurans TaxID=319653 RepID=UPI0020A82DC2|nr:hypothetical protein [Pediococcus ethanolidurans]MCV3328058.1 hypothetical protein [Pediococcus ethanolidurans]